MKNYSQSAEMYKKALALNPKSTICYCEYSNVLCYLGEFENAIKTLDNALNLDPFNALALYYKCRLCSLFRDIDEAFYYLERSINLYDGFKSIAINDSFLNNLKLYSRFKDLTGVGV